MKSSFLLFLFSLVLVSSSVASPMNREVVSTAFDADSNSKVSHWLDEDFPENGNFIDRAVMAAKEAELHSVSFMKKACGPIADMAMEQQFAASNSSPIKVNIFEVTIMVPVRNCITAVRNWVEIYGRSQPIKLIVYLGNPKETAGILSDTNLFGPTDRAHFDIEVSVEHFTGTSEKIYDALKVNQGITTLNLWGNSILDQGAEKLAEALKQNNGLKNLILGESCIRDKGAKALAEALEKHPAIKSLNVLYNYIGYEGKKALEELKAKGIEIIGLERQK